MIYIIVVLDLFMFKTTVNKESYQLKWIVYIKTKNVIVKNLQILCACYCNSYLMEALNLSLVYCFTGQRLRLAAILNLYKKV